MKSIALQGYESARWTKGGPAVRAEILAVQQRKANTLCVSIEVVHLSGEILAVLHPAKLAA